jgi:hypothetical protein
MMPEGDSECLYDYFHSAVVANEAAGSFPMLVSVLSGLLVVQAGVVLSLDVKVSPNLRYVGFEAVRLA